MDADVIIIGSGPAGYVAAIRAGQVGFKTILIEKDRIGGMCLNWGCIPTKALLESAKLLQKIKSGEEFGIEGIDSQRLSFNWTTAKRRAEKVVGKLRRGIEFLLKKNGVEVIFGDAQITSEHAVTVDDRRIEAGVIIIATGSMPQKAEYTLPADKVLELPALLKQTEIPPRIVVIGHSAVAVELAQLFTLIGREVTLIAFADRLLPGIDPYMSEYLEKILKKQEISILKKTVISAWDSLGLHTEEKLVPCDLIIHAPDRAAVMPPSALPLSLENGFIHVDKYFQTSVPGIYAVGDVNGRSNLAHAASSQGLYLINHLQGLPGEFPGDRLPFNLYTYPEIAQIGASEPELRQQGIDYKINEFPLTANGKALTEGTSDGFIRILSEKKYGEVLGVQIAAAHATDMIAEASLLMEMEGTVFDLARTIHAHPTVSEIYMEAGLDAFGQAIHK